MTDFILYCAHPHTSVLAYEAGIDEQGHLVTHEKCILSCRICGTKIQEGQPWPAVPIARSHP